MALFQLDPQSIAQRVQAGGQLPRVPTLGESVLRGMIGFTLVSLGGFAPWVLAGRWFYRNLGEVGLYATCAIVFIGLSGLLLHRLIVGPGSLVRFYKIFSLAFRRQKSVKAEIQNYSLMPISSKSRSRLRQFSTTLTKS